MFDCLSPKSMQYQCVILLFVLFLKSHCTGYNCSDFYNGFGEPLEECPHAKFMMKDNLVECFANFTKSIDAKGKGSFNNYVDVVLPFLITYTYLYKNNLQTENG